MMDSYNVLINRFLDLVNIDSLFNCKKSITIKEIMSQNIAPEGHPKSPTQQGSFPLRDC